MKIKLKPIQQQSVVLFGATSGIGLETALRMVEKGARVAIVGRDQEGLDVAIDRVREHLRIRQVERNRRKNNGGEMVATETQVIGIRADVTDWEQVKNAADQVMASFGRIDTWVHLAAVSEWALFEDTSPEEFRQIVDVNLVGQAYGAMAALPYMKQQGAGALILVSSVAGRIPIPYQAAYVAAKHGIMGMAESLRLELVHNEVPVSVTTILPASINTPMFSKARTKIGVEPAPLPPVYDARVVADAILYAAQHPVREIVVGGSGFMLQSMSRWSKPVTSAYMKETGFALQHSDMPKSTQEPDNLFAHVQGYEQVEGDYTDETRKFSVYTWWQTHPVARIVVFTALLGGAVFLGYRVVKGRKKLTFWQRVGKQINEIKMPSVRRQRSLPQKVAQRAVKAGQALPMPTMPFVRRRAWWESLPFFALLPFMRRKSMFERARGQIHDAVSDLGKQTRKLSKATRKLDKVTGQLNKAAKQVPVEKAAEMIGKIDAGKAVIKADRAVEKAVRDTSYAAEKAAVDVDYAAKHAAVEARHKAKKAALKAGHAAEETTHRMPLFGRKTAVEKAADKIQSIDVGEMADNVKNALPDGKTRSRLKDRLPFM